MSIFVRPAKEKDLEDLYNLARQFVLLNLPANKAELKKIIDCSLKSFQHELPKEQSEFLFVVEDQEVGRVVATSKIVSKHGTKSNPHIYYKITKKEKFSTDLGLGFIHQILTFCEDTDGPTELGGLVVDRAYRRRPEKVGKIVSLSRFLYLSMYPEFFEKRLHCELAPPLNSDGKSEFWEALGRRFTGMPYEEADRLSHENKEFISSLFPEDEIYMTLLESKARLVVGEVGHETKPARALMERLGFKYKNEVDPFDGGPHLGAHFDEVKPIQQFKKTKLKIKKKLKSEKKLMLIGGMVDGEFRAKMCSPELKGPHLCVHSDVASSMGFLEDQEVYVIPMDYAD